VNPYDPKSKYYKKINPPVIEKTIPEAGDIDVDRNLEEVKITFSKQMEYDTLLTALIVDDNSMQFEMSDWVWDKETKTAIFKISSAPLKPLFTYTLIFSNTASDVKGLELKGDYQWSFTTGAGESPIAVAGEDQIVIQSSIVQLDGAGSTDPEKDSLSYMWLQESGEPVSLYDSTSAQPYFNAPVIENTLIFRLTTNDGFTDSSTDTISITVLESIHVAITGDNSNPGTTTNPKKTITNAIALGELIGETINVLVSEGLQSSRVQVDWQ
jgi:hypothetical protein